MMSSGISNKIIAIGSLLIFALLVYISTYGTHTRHIIHVEGTISNKDDNNSGIRVYGETTYAEDMDSDDNWSIREKIERKMIEKRMKEDARLCDTELLHVERTEFGWDSGTVATANSGISNFYNQ